MTEQEFIAQEQAKGDKKLQRLLDKVNRTGKIGREAAETLLCNDLIIFGGPRPGVNPYNCYRLTERGKTTLDSLS